MSVATHAYFCEMNNLIGKTGLVLIACFATLLMANCNRKKDPNHAIQPLPTENTYSAAIRIKALSDAINIHPEDPELYYQRGQYFLENGQGKEAFDDAQMAIKLNANECKYFILESKAILTIPNLERALASAEKAASLNCNTSEFKVHMGHLALIQRDYKTAQDYLNEALKLDKNNAEAIYYRGLIFKDRADTARALKEFQTVVAKQPEFADAYNSMASLYFDQAKWELGREILFNGLRFSPNQPMLLYNMGMYHFYNNRNDSAQSWYEKAVFFNQNLFQGYFMLGRIAFEAKDYATALSQLEIASRLAPKESLIAYYYAMAADYQGNKEIAKAQYQIVAASDNKYKASAQKRLLSIDKAAQSTDSTLVTP